ncbi:serine/threonine-protein kinase ATG1a [Typha angustifolia]|uniref:serine/threonine-protein kinase ATG1a n=1 Tax=Typha angustifolia TaxID=59011 RepID=UPI003C306ABC
MEEGVRTVGDYLLGEKIGSGSFAVVWRARHRHHGGVVAVKEIDKNKVDSKVRDGFLKEFTILRNISHPNIVRYYQAIQTEDKLFLILEYCSGGDLSDYIMRHGNRGRVSEAVARSFMRQLAEGLKVLRENNLIHRDLKPQNLLLTTSVENPLLKIADFGFARYLMPQGLADTICGSPLYMAPEIMQDRKYDAKADLWSIGIILFQLVTGNLPFDGKTHYQLFQRIMASDDLQFPPTVLADLHPDCIDLCRGLLRRNPVERLAFEEFFNHGFMAATSINAGVVDTRNTAKLRDHDPCDVIDINASSMNKGHPYTHNSCVSDLLDSIEREYVIVDHDFTLMELLSSSLEISMQNSSSSRVANDGPPTTNGPSLIQAGDSTHDLDSMENRTFAPLPLSESSAVEDMQAMPIHPFSRLRLLNQYIHVLTELAEEKHYAGFHMESFSVELVILAVWKEALRLCSIWMAQMPVGDVPKTSATDNLHHWKHNMSPNIEGMDSNIEGMDLPLSVSRWAEKGFICAYDRAEEISTHLQEINENVDMPDAMEIIFQTALVAGRSGAVKELMGQWNSAAASYSKAIILLTFIMVEAMSLQLSPQFSLSPLDHRRIHKYIMNLRTRMCNSQMAEPHPTHTHDCSC